MSIIPICSLDYVRTGSNLGLMLLPTPLPNLCSKVRYDLKIVSKSIAALLLLPMSTVGDRLRELRADQDQKVNK